MEIVPEPFEITPELFDDEDMGGFDGLSLIQTGASVQRSSTAPNAVEGMMSFTVGAHGEIEMPQRHYSSNGMMHVAVQADGDMRFF